MPADVTCPVCDGGYSARGLESHLNSHNKEEIVKAVADALRGNELPVSKECQTNTTEEIATQAIEKVEQIRMKSDQSRDRIKEKASKTIRSQ